MAMNITKSLLLLEGDPFQKIRKANKSRLQMEGRKIRFCQKTRYRYHNSAVQALTKARHQRNWALVVGVEGIRTETRIYWHEECNSYHLTSQPLKSFQEAKHAA